MSDLLKRRLSLIIGMLLTIDAIWLISLHKMHLGVILPLILGIGLILYCVFFSSLQRLIHKSHLRIFLWRLLWIGFFAWLLSLIAFFGYLHYTTQHHSAQQPVKAIIVLGSGIENAQPSLTLQQRLNVSAAYAIQYPEAILVMAGGLGFQQKHTEAEIMSKFLQKHHQIHASRILLEDKSTSTEQNLLNSKTLLLQHQIQLHEPIAIATSDFHILRAKAIAKHQGYQDIISLSAPTPLYIRYNSWLREYFAFISGWLLNEY